MFHLWKSEKNKMHLSLLTYIIQMCGELRQKVIQILIKTITFNTVYL